MAEYFGRPVTWAYYTLIAIFCFLESRASIPLEDGSHLKTEKVFLPYLLGICVLVVFWISIYDYAHDLQFYLMPTVAGCLLIVSGIGIRLISIHKLNRYFVSHIALVNNHQLITTGIYSYIRHPSELGLLSICSGVTILLSSMTGLWVVALILLPLTIYRMSLEDKLLQSLFTAEYDKYKARTPPLLPKLM